MARGARAAAALLLGALALGDAGGGAPWVDPLDAPARASPLVSRRPLVALAWAGRRVVAVGQRGHVIWSDDGGARWTQAAVPVSSDLAAVTFADPEHGWAAGHDGVVLATRDGGATWTRQLDGHALGALLRASVASHAGAPAWLVARVDLLAARPGEPFLDVWFDDARSGFAVGAFGLVVRTRDGGASWVPWLDRAEAAGELNLYAVRRVGGTLWIAGERGLLLRLDPRTERLVRVETPYGGTFFGLAAAGDALLVHGLRGKALHSADGGRSFTPVATDVEDAIVGSAVFPGGRVVLLASGGRLLVGGGEGGALRVAAEARGAPAAAVLGAGRDEVLVAGAAGVERVTLRPAAGGGG